MDRRLLWVSLLALACLPSPIGGSPAARTTRYDGHPLVRFQPNEHLDLALIEAMGGVALTEPRRGRPMDVIVPPRMLSEFDRASVEYEILHHNAQVLDDARLEFATRCRSGDPRTSAWFDQVRPLDQINQWMQLAGQTHTHLVSLHTIGESAEGREIQAMTIASDSHAGRPALVFTGAMHGDEWITPMVVLAIADLLLADYGNDPAITRLLDSLDFHFVPVMNPDGFEYAWDVTSFWRKNRRVNEGSICPGVDLNRNWPTGWGGPGSHPSPCNSAFHGESPQSESETLAVSDFVQSRPEIAAAIDFHAYDTLILTPYGHTGALPTDQEHFDEIAGAMQQTIAAASGTDYEFGPIYSTYNPASGNMVDWLYEERGIFSFGIELPSDDVPVVLAEMLPAVIELAEWTYDSVSCTDDLDHNGIVDIDDIFQALIAWGPCPPRGFCPADVSPDGVVDIDDIFFILGHWGPCPLSN